MERDEKLDPGVIAAVLSVSLLILCGLLTETATNIAFPTLMEEYGVDASSVQWLTTGKMLVVAMITPLSAFLKKRFVTKNVFIFSCLAFLIGCLLGTFAWNFDVLVAAAIIQGLGIGVALPMVFNIILEQVPPAKTGTMMGIASLIMAAGPALGPTFGGIVVTMLGWRAIFSLMIPFTLVSLLGGGITIKQKNQPSGLRPDIPGALLVMLGFFFLIDGITGLESFSEKPLQIVFLGFSFVLSNYLQIVCGASAFVTGLCLLPGAMGQAVLSVCSGMILDRCGAMKPIYFGSVLAIIGSGLFFVSGAYMETLMVVVFYVIMEVGLGCTYGNTMTHALQNILPKDNSDGNAVFNTFGQLAGALGTSVSAVILTVFQKNSAYSSLTFATAAGIHWIFGMFLVLLLLNFVFQIAAFHKASVKE